MAATSRMQTAIDEIRHSRNWIAQIVNKKKQEQRNMLLSPPIQATESSAEAPIQEAPPICHVQRHTADDIPIDEERSAAKQQQKYHMGRSSMDTLSVGSFAESTALGLSSRNEEETTCAMELDVVGNTNDPLPDSCNHLKYRSSRRRKTKAFMFALTQFMLFLFLVALGVDARSKTESPIFCHPLLMGGMLVLSTEATAVLQFTAWPFPAGKKRRIGIFHTTLQCLAIVVGVVGIGECIHRRKDIRSRTQAPEDGTSGHGCLGRLTIFIFLTQLAFGMYTRFSSALGGNGQPKHYLIKYHRAFGYIVLVVLWLSAWLGVHNPQWTTVGSRASSGLSNWVWVFIFSGLMVGILVPLDKAKFGFK
ncbi:hypothetical protein IW140_000808 [Coemansia sp. RSA 1813]|nr:hypothetical protein EV178_006235 [Coemansia sp. RSA 1646]KAJ1765922.1 hypothetical protein LPJ74_006142 [Coemansia sp. RSA 1843]KAJ2093350.1 hypothetical protein IW138_000200 [Coemansia sp. RSA 986]KAJ2217159.1 hypothetical protein EV179_000626 [Coemansia sp. RSA 487]KAJ2572357.1 hypothetical protein IW140_000808 [Coemansia sp. RSA 1813]